MAEEPAAEPRLRPPAAEEAPAERAEPAAAPAQEEAPAEPEEQLSPKERRRRARSAHTGEAAPARTLEERASPRAPRRARQEGHAAVRAYRRKRKRARETQRTGGGDAGRTSRRPTPREKTRQGVVVSDKADKTITVRVDIARQHRRYGKIVRTSSTLHAHDEPNDAHVGDTVRVVESRPLSRTKRWRLVEVLERAR